MAESTSTTGDAAPGKPPRVLADPHAELPIKNYKYVKNCTELYLSQRGIDEIAHFEGFVNLESLWLNDNRITSLEGLDQCFRIKELYAHNNRIKTLHGSSLAFFGFLHTLRLNNNRIRDLQATLAVLVKLHHLEDLDLYGNPVEEEDNYRLHVIRAVPSLLVLDRHVVTEDERNKAERLDDEPALAGKRGGVEKTQGNAQVQEKKKAKDGGDRLVPGAPPQAMSGTVKMLFKEVDTIQKEAEAAKRAADEKELRLMAEQQLQLTSPSKGISTSRVGSYSHGGLDAWEVAALEKKFKSLEDKAGAGVLPGRIVELLAYLSNQGFAVKCLERLSSELQPTELASLLFPGEAKISWKQLKLSLEQSRLQCRLLPSAQLRQRVTACFDQAAALQKRLQTGSKHGGTSDEKLASEIHEVVQRAYRLSALAERSEREDGGVIGSGKPPPLQDTLSPLRSRYYATTFAREETETAKFHELKEQSRHVNAELAAKYKFQQKDFQKYMVKKAPPTTTLARKQFTM